MREKDKGGGVHANRSCATRRRFVCRLYSRQLWPHKLQVANFVMGSSAERVCISWKQASLALHFGHIICVVRCRLGWKGWNDGIAGEWGKDGGTVRPLFDSA